MIRYRIIPFRTLGTREQMFTLVCEHLENGRVVHDNRHAMKADVFAELVCAVNTAWQHAPLENT